MRHGQHLRLRVLLTTRILKYIENRFCLILEWIFKCLFNTTKYFSLLLSINFFELKFLFHTEKNLMIIAMGFVRKTLTTYFTFIFFLRPNELRGKSFDKSTTIKVQRYRQSGKRPRKNKCFRGQLARRRRWYDGEDVKLGVRLENATYINVEQIAIVTVSGSSSPAFGRPIKTLIYILARCVSRSL